MRRVLVLAAGLVLFGTAAAAQGETADLLRQSRELYERLEFERALPLLRRVVAPGWPFEITDAQRVEAYKYLGAALSLSGKADSAILYFQAALEREPFTDLDARDFTPDQLAAFAAARRRTFAVGVRGGEQRVDPRTQRITFTVVSTHAAALRGTVRGLGGTGQAVQLFAGRNEGIRQLTWDGLGGDARLAAPGRYEILVIGQSEILSRTDSARLYIDLLHEIEPLEDTLGSFGPAELLPERHRRGAGVLDFAKALGVAAGALLITEVFSNRQLGTGDEARWVAGVAVATGVVGLVHRSGHAELPDNIAVNQRRRGERDAANAAIRQRNAERIGRTILVVRLAAGIGVESPP